MTDQDDYTPVSSSNRVALSTSSEDFQDYFVMGPTYPPIGKYKLRWEIGLDPGNANSTEIRILFDAYALDSEKPTRVLFFQTHEWEGIGDIDPTNNYGIIDINCVNKYIFTMQIRRRGYREEVAHIMYGAMFLEKVG